MKTMVMLDCFPYPDFKPKHDGQYIVQYDQDTLFSDKISTLSWKGEDWLWDGDKVIAWAEMPESLTDG